MVIYWISLFAFIAVAALVIAAYSLLQDLSTPKVEERLQVLATGTPTEIEDHGILKKEVFREGLAGLQGIMHGWMRRILNFNRLFEEADSPISGNVFVGLSFGCGALGVVISALLQSPPALYPVIALACGGGPLGWMLLRRRSRLRRFARQLPDALELVARALRSGNSFVAAIQVVSEEMLPPIASEFQCVCESQNLGMSIDRALNDLAERIPSPDLRFFVTAVNMQRQMGGDLAEILEKIAYIVRERFKILGQVQALTGEGRISGSVLMALPVLLFLVMYQLNPKYVSLLFTHPMGKKMLAIAIVLQVLGALPIRKIVNIKI